MKWSPQDVPEIEMEKNERRFNVHQTKLNESPYPTIVISFAVLPLYNSFGSNQVRVKTSGLQGPT